MSISADVTSQILKAGGLVPLKAKIGKDDSVDTVVARAYSHAALPGRVVIRLTAENVTRGDDLEMSTLGFGPGEDRGAVAKERRRPLGFPGWALVHDPKNARFALDVVDELKKQIRKAKSKPGHAKDGIDAIAAKLAKSVPHFLPSFYEEAGRGFIEHGAIPQAAIMFGKARDAEAVHALEVDEQARVDGFLEFALAGAVTTKALAQYAKDLAEHHEPKVAYQHYRQLCLQRTLGGMPPWSGMASELRKLAKGAKLDTKAEDASFVAEIIESPALAKAAGEFWRTYEEPIVALGTSSAKVRGVLLNLFPTGTAYKPDLDEAWLDLLEKTGAVGALVGDDASPEARPLAGRAAWFDKLCSHLSRDYRSDVLSERVFELLKRMAPMLVADGKPIVAAGRWGYQIDLDLAELALSLGVPVELPKEHGQFNLQAWAKHAGDNGRGLDPVRVAAHPQLGPALASTVGAVIGFVPFDSASRNKQGFLAAKRAFVEDVIARAEKSALPGLEEALNVVASKLQPETFAEMRDLYERFVALAIGPALGRTLRIGLVDELGWPALEAVEQEIDPDGSVPWTVHGALPALCIATKAKVIAVGHAGKLGEHDLVVPPQHEFSTCRFIDGEFLVVLKHGYSTMKAYWSSAPADLFETPSIYTVPSLVGRAAVAADGAWLEGTKVIRKGERDITLGGFASTDGSTTWVAAWKDGAYKWYEHSLTGEQGRASYPPFLEEAAQGDWRIDVGNSYVMPAPAGVESSPLGVANGTIGVRVTYQQSPSSNLIVKRAVTRIDGVTFEPPLASTVTNLVTLPGGTVRPLNEESVWREGIKTSILDGAAEVRGSVVSSSERRYSRGQVAALPPIFWHHFVPRDEAGSKRLREISDEDARALVAAVPTTTDANGPSGVVFPKPKDFSAAILPEVTHPRLRAGVEGVAVMAAELALRHAELVKTRAPGAKRAVPQVAATIGVPDTTLLEILQPWTGRSWGSDGTAWVQIERAGQWFASEDRSDRVEKTPLTSRVEWFWLAMLPWSLGFIASAIGTPADKRAKAIELLEHLVKSLPLGNKLRVVHADGVIEGDTAERSLYELRWRGGNAYVLRKVSYYGNQLWILEYAPDGVFEDLPGLSKLTTLVGTSGPSLDEVAAFAGAVKQGKTSWSEAAAERLATATGLTPSEATFFWGGCPSAHDSSANFMDKELREQLGLKATQAALARDAINAIAAMKRLAIVDATARAGASALVDGSAVETCAQAWIAQLGKRVAIPEDVLADADKEILWLSVKPAQALAIYASGGDTPQLQADGIWALKSDGSIIRASKPEPLVGQTPYEATDEVFDVRMLQMHCAYAPFLYQALPVGAELRSKVPIVHELVKQRLANPHLWLDAGNRYDPSSIAAALDALGGEELTGMDANIAGRRHGPAVTVKTQWRVDLRLQPAGIDAKTMSIVGKLVDMVSAYGNTWWDAIVYARSADLQGIVDRIENTPVPAGGWEQNALLSAPSVVDAVAKHHELSREAAALYLQYLVLLWPTAKNLAEWNAWKPKQLQTATQELVDMELVLEAKRERAQRGVFLPGAWEALKSPHPPFETWKLPFYGKRAADGSPQPFNSRFAPTVPFHVMYERAWTRIQSGDVPRYEEVKR